MNKVAAYARLFRIPGLGGLAIPPVIAALTVGVYNFYNLTILFIIGAFAAIYGFILNDYSDVEIDKIIRKISCSELTIFIKTYFYFSVFILSFDWL